MARKKKINAPSGVQALKLLIVIVYWRKMDSFIDVIEEQEINMVMILQGRGTGRLRRRELFGFDEQERAVIVATVREDKEKATLEMLEDRFSRLKDSEGVAFTCPMDSLIGVAIYQFLSNQKVG